MTEKDDCMNNKDISREKEQRDKISVPVRRHKHNDKEELQIENDEDRLIEVPRRWREY